MLTAILSAKKTDSIVQFKYYTPVLNQQAALTNSPVKKKRESKMHIKCQVLTERTFQGRQAGCNMSHSYRDCTGLKYYTEIP
jgi:hypothetical protein